MNRTDTIIIGEGFIGLFAGIKIASKGYNVKIFEKNCKPLFIENIRLIFPENYFTIKKLLSKLQISYEIIINNNETIKDIILKLDRMPTSLQQELLFSEACNTILTQNIINILKHEIYEFTFLMNIDTYSAIQLIKKNYINVSNYIKITECSLIILKKMRDFFKSLNGQIYYNSNVHSIEVNPCNQFICNINNRSWYSNILISTINVENLLKIHNWSENIYSALKLYSNHYNRKIYNIVLNKCKLAIPYKYLTPIKNFNINNLKINIFKLFNNDIHFYVCNDDFSYNPYWINGTLDIINDICKYI